MNEIHNPAWPVVAARIEERLQSLRNKLEAPGLDFAETQVLRGEIRALKHLLGLPGEIQEARRAQMQSPIPFGDWNA